MHFPGGSAVKNPPADAGDARDAGLIPGSERSLGVGNDNPLQYSCLEISIDTAAWQATVQGGSQRVRHDWVTSLSLTSLITSRRLVVQSLSPVGHFCDPGDCSPPVSPAHGIFQARILEWVAISFSKGSF